MLPFSFSTIVHSARKHSNLDLNISKTSQIEHLCVLVHGFYGSNANMQYMADALLTEFKDKNIHILIVKGNGGYLTLDGIEQGGERVCQEIEDEIACIEASGHKVRKLSVAGYSLGGLFARYAIGLLYSKGYFERIVPMNFVTFATPHLGTRTPQTSYLDRLRNVLGARILSLSGRQLFMIDRFRKTGRPLLDILADPNSVFMHGLSLFKRKSIYANIVNEIDTIFYTTGISEVDPFEKMDVVALRYVKGYENVIVDWTHPFESPSSSSPTTLQKAARKVDFSAVGGGIVYTFNALLGLLLAIPFLFLQAYLSIKSARRIILHKRGRTEIRVSDYRVPLLVQGMQIQADQLYQSLNHSLPTGHLAESVPFEKSPSAGNAEDKVADRDAISVIQEIEKMENTGIENLDEGGVDSKPGPKAEHLAYTPILALTPTQFSMIRSLDTLGLQRFPVHMHLTKESHAAIIVRFDRPELYEGKTVIKHWLREEFLL